MSYEAHSVLHNESKAQWLLVYQYVEGHREFTLLEGSGTLCAGKSLPNIATTYYVVGKLNSLHISYPDAMAILTGSRGTNIGWRRTS